MLTLFTIPKAFRGHIAVIQMNAIRSWTRLRPECEIILFGDDEGTAEAAVELGVRHVPEIARNAHGTPLLDDVFQKAQQLAVHGLVCYINTDIIMFSDFLAGVRQVVARKRRFLMVGQRWNLDVPEPLEFSTGWEERLKARVANEGSPDFPTAIDYFLFPKGVLGEIPPFAVGRTVWDNWLLYRARALETALIDASALVMAVHQRHDYSHHQQAKDGVWFGPEAKRNLELAGGWPFLFNFQDATHLLTPSGLKLALDGWHLSRHRETLPGLYPSLAVPLRVLNKLLSLSHPVRAWLGLTLRSGGPHA